MINPTPIRSILPSGIVVGNRSWMLQDTPYVTYHQKDGDDVEKDQLNKTSAPLIIIAVHLRHGVLEHRNDVIDHEENIEERYSGA